MTERILDAIAAMTLLVSALIVAVGLFASMVGLITFLIATL